MPAKKNFISKRKSGFARQQDNLQTLLDIVQEKLQQVSLLQEENATLKGRAKTLDGLLTTTELLLQQTMLAAAEAASTPSSSTHDEGFHGYAGSGDHAHTSHAPAAGGSTGGGYGFCSEARSEDSRADGSAGASSAGARGDVAMLGGAGSQAESPAVCAVLLELAADRGLAARLQLVTAEHRLQGFRDTIRHISMLLQLVHSCAAQQGACTAASGGVPCGCSGCVARTAAAPGSTAGREGGSEEALAARSAQAAALAALARERLRPVVTGYMDEAMAMVIHNTAVQMESVSINAITGQPDLLGLAAHPWETVAERMELQDEQVMELLELHTSLKKRLQIVNERRAAALAEHQEAGVAAGGAAEGGGGRGAAGPEHDGAAVAAQERLAAALESNLHSFVCVTVVHMNYGIKILTHEQLAAGMLAAWPYMMSLPHTLAAIDQWWRRRQQMRRTAQQTQQLRQAGGHSAGGRY